MPFAEDDIPGGVAGVQRKTARREADLRLHKLRIEMNPFRPRRNLATCRFQQRPSFVMQDVDANFLQHGQRRLMH